MGRHSNETLMRAWSPKEDCHPEIVIGESALMRTQCGAQPPRSLCARPSSVLPSLSPAGPLQLGTHPAPRGAPPAPPRQRRLGRAGESGAWRAGSISAGHGAGVCTTTLSRASLEANTGVLILFFLKRPRTFRLSKSHTLLLLIR